MRVFLADNQPRVRFALRKLLEQQPGLEVLGEAVDAEDLLTQTQKDCPDLVLLDWGLPGLAALDLLSALRGPCPDLVVIVLSGRVLARKAALAAGADAFVSKGDPPERLLAAIDDCGTARRDGVDRARPGVCSRAANRVRISQEGGRNGTSVERLCDYPRDTKKES
jgi:DNA-binding NarL/FixJ family response regulator